MTLREVFNVLLDYGLATRALPEHFGWNMPFGGVLKLEHGMSNRAGLPGTRCIVHVNLLTGELLLPPLREDVACQQLRSLHRQHLFAVLLRGVIFLEVDHVQIRGWYICDDAVLDGESF